MRISAKWKRGFETMYRADAQTVAEEILSIGDSATPEQIVDKGRDESTQLHRCFTWDDTVAAEKWRKHEAQLIVHFLVIDRKDEEQQSGENYEVRYFHKCETGQGYKPTKHVFQNEDEYSAMVRRAAGELEAFSRKYRFLSDMDEMTALLDAVGALLAAS